MRPGSRRGDAAFRTSPISSRPGEEECLRLATFLPYRLSVAAAAVSEGLAGIYERRFGIAIPQWRVLATAAEFGAITATAIGEHAAMSKVKVSRAAAALERRGLLSRRSNEEDLREAFLVLTPAGWAMYEEIVPLARAYVDALTGSLGEEDLARFDALLERILEAAGRIDRPAPTGGPSPGSPPGS